MTRRSLGLALLCAACRVGQEYSEPEVALPPQFSAQESVLDATETRWWTGFGDAELELWIARSIESNRDLRMALERVAEARAIVEIEGGAARPSLDAGASFARQNQSNNVVGGSFFPRGDSSAHGVGFDARWELDLFGHTQRTVEAAQAGYDATVEDARATLQRLIAEVARTYVELRGFDEQLVIVDAHVAALEDTARLVRSRVAAGLDDELAAQRLAGLIASTRAERPALESSRAARAHALAVLAGAWPAETAQTLERGELPTPPSAIATGLPIDLLRRRPDIRRAERELARAAALSAQATTELYPRLSLAASFGWESERLDQLLDTPSRAWRIGPSIVGPLFRSGVIQAGIRARGAQQTAALAVHEQAVLEALREVEDALVAFANARRRVVELDAALAAEARAVELASERFARGLDDYLGVLDAQRSALGAAARLSEGRTAHTVAAIALYKALGGGWEDALPALATRNE
ncbi:MAG: efflux transporter outer membrane subunit [Planctomycetes bacterium]|nr:efflux transporter outer membrane subunit [Planctomycetota bacterium]